MKKILIGTFLYTSFAQNSTSNANPNNHCKLPVAQITEIKELTKSMEDIEWEMKKFKVGVHTIGVYHLGSTGVGKSTLINYLLNAQMNCQGNIFSWKIHPQNQQQFDSLPKIGNTANSETNIPSIYYDRQFPVAYIDTPGFFNNKKDKKQEIKEAYSNSLLFKKGQKIKIMLVIEASQILSQKGDDLFKVIRQLSKLFSHDFLSISQATTLIISKAPQGLKQIFCIQRIKDLMKTRDNLTNEERNFIGSIISKKIILFGTPNNLDQNKISQLKQSILKTASKQLKQNSKMYVNSEIKQFSASLAKQIQSSVKCFEEYIQTKMKEKFIAKIYDSSLEVLEGIKELEKAHYIFKQHSNSLVNEDILKKFLESIGIISQIFEENLNQNLGRIQFCQYLNENIQIEDTFANIAATIQDYKEYLDKILMEKYREEKKTSQDILLRLEKKQSEIQFIKRKLNDAVGEISKLKNRKCSVM